MQAAAPYAFPGREVQLAPATGVRGADRNHDGATAQEGNTQACEKTGGREASPAGDCAPAQPGMPAEGGTLAAAAHAAPVHPPELAGGRSAQPGGSESTAVRPGDWPAVGSLQSKGEWPREGLDVRRIESKAERKRRRLAERQAAACAQPAHASQATPRAATGSPVQCVREAATQVCDGAVRSHAAHKHKARKSAPPSSAEELGSPCARVPALTGVGAAPEPVQAPARAAARHCTAKEHPAAVSQVANGAATSVPGLIAEVASRALSPRREPARLAPPPMLAAGIAQAPKKHTDNVPGPPTAASPMGAGAASGPTARKGDRDGGADRKKHSVKRGGKGQKKRTFASLLKRQ